MKNEEQKIILQRLTTWLEQMGKSRAWIAEKIGVSESTVNGWYAPRGKRDIPAPIITLIEMLLKENELGEPRFTYMENQKIQRAMNAADYVNFPDFAHDAVMTMAEEILKKESNLEFPATTNKVAEDITPYRA